MLLQNTRTLLKPRGVTVHYMCYTFVNSEFWSLIILRFEPNAHPYIYYIRQNIICLLMPKLKAYRPAESSKVL